MNSVMCSCLIAERDRKGFRPQQGLTIMNSSDKFVHPYIARKISFRPQQGLTIMNSGDSTDLSLLLDKTSFRPQQGLTIMNSLPTKP